jgi:hypothetical protein
MSAFATAVSGVTLKDQWRLALAAACDSRLSRLDLACLIVVIDRFMKDKGNSRASSRYLAKAVRAERRNVRNSLEKLKAFGYLKEVRQGCGVRATEYLPNFALASGVADDPTTASGVADDPTTDLDPSGVVDDPTGGVVGDPTTGASGVVGDPKTYLQYPADKPAYDVSRTSHEAAARGAASPPPSPGAFGPATAVPPRDPVLGFDELWAVWWNRTQRPKAKAAYQKLNPDEALHAELVAAAQAWTDHYRDNDVEKKWCPMLHNWLAGERWLEDVPAVYEDPKSAAIANKRGRGKSERKGNGKPERLPDLDFVMENFAKNNNWAWRKTESGKWERDPDVDEFFLDPKYDTIEGIYHGEVEGMCDWWETDLEGHGDLIRTLFNAVGPKRAWDICQEAYEADDAPVRLIEAIRQAERREPEGKGPKPVKKIATGMIMPSGVRATPGRYLLKIVNSELRNDEDGKGQHLWLGFENRDGLELSHNLHFVNLDADVVLQAQGYLADIRRVTNKTRLTDSSQLLDSWVVAVVSDDGEVDYQRPEMIEVMRAEGRA